MKQLEKLAGRFSCAYLNISSFRHCPAGSKNEVINETNKNKANNRTQHEEKVRRDIHLLGEGENKAVKFVLSNYWIDNRKGGE